MPQNQVEIGIGLKDRLSKDLKKAFSNVNTFKRKVVSAFSAIGRSIFSVKGLIAGVASAYVIRGMARMIKSVASADDQFSKLNDRLGISVETLSSLKFAGEQSGIAFNTLAMALQRATKRFGEYRQTGGGSAARAIDRLGLGNLISSGATIEDLLPRLADGFKNLSSDTEKAALAAELFGVNSVAMVQLLGQGSEAIKKYQLEAQKLGITLSKEDAQAAVEFQDASNRLSKALEGLKNRAVRPLLLPLAKLLDRFTEFAIKLGPKVSKVFKEVGRYIDEIDIDRLAAEFRSLLPVIQTIGRAISFLSEGIVAMGQGFRVFSLIFNRLHRWGAYGTGSQRYGGNREGKKALDDEYIRIKNAIDDVYNAQKKLNTLKIPVKGGDEDPYRLGTVRVEATAINDQFREINHNLDSAKTAVGRFWDEYKRGAENSVIVNTVLGNAFSSFEDTMASLVLKTQTAKEAFRSMAQSIIADLIRITTRLFLIFALEKALGWIGGALGGGAAGATSSIPQSQLGLSGGLNTIRGANLNLGNPGFANGFDGTISGPTTGYPVTLHGKERVKITPMREVGKDGSGTVINNYNTVNISAVDAKSMDDYFNSAASRNGRTIANIVMNQAKMRPAIHKSMGM